MIRISSWMDNMAGRDCEAVKANQVVYELEDLLERMTEETFPEVVDFGPAVGREFWCRPA